MKTDRRTNILFFYRNGIEKGYFAERDLSNLKTRKIKPFVQQLCMDIRRKNIKRIL